MAIITCPKCGTRNRVDENRLSGEEPHCGKCGESLSVIVSEPKELSDDTFDDALSEHADKPLLVDFWASWCGPCRMVAPFVSAVAAQSAGRYAVAKVNLDDNPMLANRYNVEAIPTFLIFKEGKLVDRHTGAMSKQMLEQFVEKHV
jgi:thioredoxin 2